MTEFNTAQPALRVLVIGIGGSGKSTFPEKLAGEAGMAQAELGPINWRPGWNDRSREEIKSFFADVDQVTSQRGWVLAGNSETNLSYYPASPIWCGWICLCGW